MSDKKLQGQTEFTAKENIWMTVKYFLIVSTAGLIQMGAFNLLSWLVFHEGDSKFGWSYFIATVISIIWNYTVNRRYTFKSDTDVRRVLLYALLYNIIFVPLSTFGGQAVITRFSLGENQLLSNVVLLGIMMGNAVIEHIYQRLVIYRGKINTNDLAQKDEGAR